MINDDKCMNLMIQVGLANEPSAFEALKSWCVLPTKMGM